MSYYGVKKCSIVKNSNDNYVLKCDYYDSSMTDYNNNRIWHKDSYFYENSNYKTREELEERLFKDFLDGNLHGTYGKFAPLNWRTCKVGLSEDKKNKLEELEKARWNIPCEDNDRRKQAYEVYEEFRYTEYKKAWLEYLRRNKKQRI